MEYYFAIISILKNNLLLLLTLSTVTYCSTIPPTTHAQHAESTTVDLNGMQEEDATNYIVNDMNGNQQSELVDTTMPTSSEEFFDPVLQPWKSFEDYIESSNKKFSAQEILSSIDANRVVTMSINGTDSTTPTNIPTDLQTAMQIEDNDDDDNDDDLTHEQIISTISPVVTDIYFEDVTNHTSPYAAELIAHSRQSGKMIVGYDEDNDHSSGETFKTEETPNILSRIFSDDSKVPTIFQQDNYDNYIANDTSSFRITTATVLPPTTEAPSVVNKLYRRPANIKKIPQVQKYRANDILRNLINDVYIRTPLAALIDTAPESLRMTKQLWNEALQPNTEIDIVLVAFNMTGVGVTYTFKNTRTMLAGLNSINESTNIQTGGTAFLGIMRATELVPYDSAIFVCTNTIPIDINLARLTTITLLKKRIRLHLIWFGRNVRNQNEPNSDTDAGILGEVALNSGGEIMKVAEESIPGHTGTFQLVSPYNGNGLRGTQPIDNGIDSVIVGHNDDISILVKDENSPNGG